MLLGRLLAALVVCLPLLAVTGGVAWVAVGERTGSHPLSLSPARNSAEAAAAADPAAMLRFMRQGDDPTRVKPVRPELISSEVLFATTLEAAMWARELNIVRLLDDEGAIVGADQRLELACLAEDLDLMAVAEYLVPERTCEPGAALRRVKARTRPEKGRLDD